MNKVDIEKAVRTASATVFKANNNIISSDFLNLYQLIKTDCTLEEATESFVAFYTNLIEASALTVIHTLSDFGVLQVDE